MKHLTTAFFTAFTMAVFAQADTIFTHGISMAGTVTRASKNKVSVLINNEEFTYSLNDEDRVKISPANVNKGELDSLYTGKLKRPVKTKRLQVDLEAEDPINVFPLKDSLVYYSGVVGVDNVSKEELYKRAKLWMIDEYRSAADVIQLDDKENWQLIGKGLFKEYWQVNILTTILTNVNHKITLSFKDGRFKYEVTEFIVDYCVEGYLRSYNGGYAPCITNTNPLEKFDRLRRPQNTLNYYKDINKTVLQYLYRLKKAMATPISTDNW